MPVNSSAKVTAGRTEAWSTPLPAARLWFSQAQQERPIRPREDKRPSSPRGSIVELPIGAATDEVLYSIQVDIPRAPVREAQLSPSLTRDAVELLGHSTPGETHTNDQELQRVHASALQARS